MIRAQGRELVAGGRAMVPWLIGVTPFGLVIGVSAAQADIPTLAGWLTGPVIYAGSAQVAAIEMLDGNAAPLAVIVTALVINLRIILYSAAMAPHWRGTPWWWRLLAGYLLIDPSFAVGIKRYAAPGHRAGAHAFYLGGAIALWVTWLVAIGAGAAAGARLPAWLHLEFLVPLFLVGEVVPKLFTVAYRRAVLAAAAVAAPALILPMHAGLVVAIVAGILAGLTAQRRSAAAPTTAAPTTVAPALASVRRAAR